MSTSHAIFAALTKGYAINVIGWTLIHFIWQAAIIALLVFALLNLLRIRSANLRYIVSCAGLAMMFVCPIVTMSYLISSANSNALARSMSDHPIREVDTTRDTSIEGDDILGQPTDQSAINDLSAMSLNLSPNVSMSNSSTIVERILSKILPVLVGIWLLGVALHLVRLIVGLWRVRQWISNSKPVADSRLNLTFTSLSQRLNLPRTVRLLLTEKTKVPATAGLFRPAVLVPASLLTGLSTREMELVLAHELAHIKRHDFLVNLLQKTAESLLFYHPAVWWISSQISTERENCCDDLAVKVCGDPVALAKALTALESVRCANSKIVAAAATGGALKQRIRRLLSGHPEPVQSLIPAGLVSLFLAGILLTIVLLSLPSIAAANQKNVTTQPHPILTNTSKSNLIGQMVVPNLGDSDLVPDHLSFYGMNQTRQTKFDLVRIDKVDLGIGKPFGPANALVLDDENSDFGLLGRTWSKKVRGKQGGTLLHSAMGEFQIHSREPSTNPEKMEAENHNKKQSEPQAEDSSNALLQDQRPPQDPLRQIVDSVTQPDEFPQFEHAWKSSNIEPHKFIRCTKAGRSSVDLIKHFANVLERHDGPRPGLSITDMESIVSVIPTKRNGNTIEANEIVMSLPEGSQARAAFFGNGTIEPKIEGDRLFYLVKFNQGKIQWIDSVGIVRAEAKTVNPESELMADVGVSNGEVVIKLKANPAPAVDRPGAVRVEMNLNTGAPKDEKQPPHRSIRYKIFDESKEEDKPLRLKMMWRYDLDQLVIEAEKESGKKWDAIIRGEDDPQPIFRLDSPRRRDIWGVDDPQFNPRR